MTDSNNFKIILLSNDDRQQSRFKEIFAKVGVEAKFTHDLDQFWHLANVEEVDLCLIDVRQMSSGNRTLKNHPRVVNNELPMAFFYGANSQALVYSTYDFSHNGLINTAMSLAGQLKTILLRVENTQKVRGTVKSFEFDKEKAEHTTKKFIAENESLKQKAFYHSLLENVSKGMSTAWKEIDFYQGIGNYFESVNFINKSSFYFLNNTGNKLISPTLDNDKYEKLPSIWMDQACDNGIHMVGQNKANQITLDLWGANFVQLQFFDAYDNPVALAFIEVEEEFLEKFNWMEFENRLNSQFSRHLLSRKMSNVMVSDELSSFEFFEYIRKKKANLNRENYIIKEIDFESLFTKAFGENHLDFSWKNFSQEYFRPLLASFNFDYKICHFSGEKVFLVISEDETDNFDFEIKAYNKKFPFWRFFETPDQMVVSDLAPLTRSLPFSIAALSSQFNKKEVDKTIEKKVERKTSTATRRQFSNRSPMTM